VDNYALITNPLWRVVAKQILLALLAPQHDAVLKLPARRADHPQPPHLLPLADTPDQLVQLDHRGRGAPAR
jgi:hypothetical protein